MSASARAVSQHQPLRLRALDHEDLLILAAALRDSIVAVGDLGYDQQDACFHLIFNRFRWEDQDWEDAPSRIHTAMTIENVVQVRCRNLSRKTPGQILNLLTIALEGDGPAPELHFVFAGGIGLRIATSALSVKLTDFGDPWSTPVTPEHRLDG